MSTLHNIFSTKHSSWRELEEGIELLVDPRVKGEVFEQFVFLYLSLNKDYYQISELYRQGDLPKQYKEKLRLEKTDYGVDGAFIRADGTIAAYQAKYRGNRVTPTTHDLATFWGESEYADYRYVISNSNVLPAPADKKINSYQILADIFDELEEDFFDDVLRIYNGQKEKAKVPITPHPHQERMVKNALDGFKVNNRGKLIAACGAGKTYISLWVKEGLSSKTTLFLAPSLALIKQTLEAWVKQSSVPFDFLCVCSDASVISELNQDYGDYRISEVDFPVTTDPEAISKFLKKAGENKVIFSTYHSASVLADSIKSVEGFAFDLAIYDEAHRTAGQKESERFSLVLSDEHIPSVKRLFMTATERLVRPWVVERAITEDRVVFSMDDEEVYGALFDTYSFGEAIKDGVISDYQIIVTVVEQSEVLSWIRNNQLLIPGGTDPTKQMITAENAYKQVVLMKAMKKLSAEKVVTFHSSVKRARDFIFGAEEESIGLKEVAGLLYPEALSGSSYFDSVDGQMPAGVRKHKLREFENSNISVISNAKCLTEGVDVPVIDSVYFVDQKNSIIDIVQACGRALRKPKGKGEKVAYFIVPIILSENDSNAGGDGDGNYEVLHNVIQALKDQDERLADWIDKLNIKLAKGESLELSQQRPAIVVNAPQQFNLLKFSEDIKIRIATSNNAARYSFSRIPVRRSLTKKIIKPFADYTQQTLFSNLVKPTIDLFLEDIEMPPLSIKVNNNNVSHSERVGVVEKTASGNYKLSVIGKKLKHGDISFEAVLKLAMLNFNSGSKTKGHCYPYRFILRCLIEVGNINFYEFLFGIYSHSDSSDLSFSKAVRIINDMKKSYPNLSVIAGDAPQEALLKELNKKYETDFSFDDMWGSTTVKNKFLYFSKHLTLFEGVKKNDEVLSIEDGSKSSTEDLLEMDLKQYENIILDNQVEVAG